MSDAFEPPAVNLATLREGIRMIALRALGDADAADDVVQETVIRLLTSLRNEQPAHLGAFTLGIARHIIADMQRQASRLHRLDDLLPDQEPATSRPNALATLVSAEERELVRKALNTLSTEDRDLLRLTFFEGVRIVDLAARTSEPAERIRKRKSRALARLRHTFLSAAPPARTEVNDFSARGLESHLAALADHKVGTRQLSEDEHA